MTKPVVGVIGNAHRVENRFSTQMVGERNLRAIADVTGALPLMFAGTPEITDIDTLLGAVDGILLTGEHQRQRARNVGNGAQIALAHHLRGEAVLDLKHVADDADDRSFHCQISL